MENLKNLGGFFFRKSSGKNSSLQFFLLFFYIKIANMTFCEQMKLWITYFNMVKLGLEHCYASGT